MDLVSQYTGINFQQGTSVGMGPIFELEINFGYLGVFLGMLLLGIIIGVADRKAGTALRFDDPLTFGKWFLVGIILQNAIGSFAETTASLAAALILVSIVNHYLRSRPGPDLPGRWTSTPSIRGTHESPACHPRGRPSVRRPEPGRHRDVPRPAARRR